MPVLVAGPLALRNLRGDAFQGAIRLWLGQTQHKPVPDGFTSHIRAHPTVFNRILLAAAAQRSESSHGRRLATESGTNGSSPIISSSRSGVTHSPQVTSSGCHRIGPSQLHSKQ